MPSGSAPADVLRTTLVDQLVENGWVSTRGVEAAMRTVPRHLFAPEVSEEQAYANDVVVTKRDNQGMAMSTVSAPGIIAMMLEQADVRPGDRVLEIGSGGYNAALLAELVGDAGDVTTVDVDPDVTVRAQRCLRAAGYGQVRVLCADGEYGAEAYGPFDRIIVTVGAWDIPPAWQRQLADGGRIVVPLRMVGLTRSVVLERAEAGADRLVSRGYELCGFVPMQGAGEHPEQVVRLHGDDVVLLIDGPDSADAEALRAALAEPRCEMWSEVAVGSNQRLDGLELWLASTLTGFCRLVAQRHAIDAGVVAPAFPWGARAVVDRDTFAYLALRRVGTGAAGADHYELGAYAHGSLAQHLAEQVTEQIRNWDGEHLSARIQCYPAGAPDAELPSGRVVDKHHTRVTISWP